MESVGYSGTPKVLLLIVGLMRGASVVGLHYVPRASAVEELCVPY